MARRAAFIRSLRAHAPTKGHLLVLACPNELISADTPQTPEPKSTRAFVQALARTGYDAGSLTPAEGQALHAAGIVPPPSFVVLGPKPTTTVLTVAGLPIGLVRFPDAPATREPMPEAVAQAIVRAAASLRGRVKLVIGLSGWNSRAEGKFLKDHPGAVDVLLGSGVGGGSAGGPAGYGKSLWARAFYEGKTVGRLDLFTLPGSADFVWKLKEGFRSDVISLDDRYPSAPDVAKLF